MCVCVCVCVGGLHRKLQVTDMSMGVGVRRKLQVVVFCSRIYLVGGLMNGICRPTICSVPFLSTSLLFRSSRWPFR